MFADNLMRLIGIPFNKGMEQATPVLIGVSVYQDLYYYVAYGLNHPDFSKMNNNPSVPYKERDNDEYCLLTTDESSQDMTWATLLLVMFALYRIFYADISDAFTKLLYRQLTIEEMINLLLRLVKWLGNDFYIWLCIMLTGIYPTSTFNTLKSLIMLLYHIIKMACLYKESIQDALRCIKFVGYGDDTVMSFPMRYLKYFTDEPQLFYPEKLAATYKEFGCILKPGETEIYIPVGGFLHQLSHHFSLPR